MKQNINVLLGLMLLLGCSFSFSASAQYCEDLYYHEVTFKASHNSYEREETLAQQLTFNPGNPSNDGCLGIELDIWRHAGDFTNGERISVKYFTVDHCSPDTGEPLATHLKEVKDWHNNNPNHPPVLITLDIKSKDGVYEFNEEIDTYLQVHFGEDLVFKPGKLMYNPSLSLAENVIANGWPKVTDPALWGKFIFCLSGNDPIKTTYANATRARGYCFSDQERDDDRLPGDDDYQIPPSSGNFVFFNFNIFTRNHTIWLHTIPLYYHKNFITRVYVANSEDNFRNSIRAKVSAIATDKIRNYYWAKVSENGPCHSKVTPTEDKRSIKNVENNEYRYNRASQMQGNYEPLICDFIFEPQAGDNIYALRNAYNNQYLDCSITSMSSFVSGNCQRWRVIPAEGIGQYYIQNVENGEYLTKRASRLAPAPLSHELHILQPR